MEDNIFIEEEIILDNDFYTEDGLEQHKDDDQISASEQGFMRGYLSAI